MEEAEELSSRVGIIDHGKLIALGTQRELTRTVGQWDTLRLHLSEGDDVVSLADGLRGIEGTVQVTAVDHQIALIVPNAQEALPAAVNRAAELGYKLRSVDIEEPNLEAVFLHLTGRALRD
jgi:ABC-2 type transport system ATP-binding protein